MLSSNNADIFLTLIRLGIGHYSGVLPESIDWAEMESMAARHGLLAILIDGVEKLPESLRPSKMILLQWIGEVLQNYEQRYGLYHRAIAEMASWYNDHGFNMMVLKGYACSLDWPRPEHRPCGDIDIWQFGQQKAADAVLAKEKGIKIDSSHHHHTVFYWRDFMVENHYDFDNIYARKSNREIEPIFKNLGKDNSYLVEIIDASTNSETKVYMPSPNLHALFLLRHMTGHFVGSEINLRQVLDWGFFVEKHTKEIDWKWLVNVVEQYHMKDFYNCINAICVGDLGFSVNIFPQVQFEPKLKERVFNDIFFPEFSGSEPRGLFKRIAYKILRWKGNAWKQELCYGESRFEALLYGFWAKILKPRSI